MPAMSEPAAKRGAGVLASTPAFVAPPKLCAGDRVAVVAPSSPFPREDFFRGLAWLAGRYRIAIRTSILSRDGYLAGDDERRAEELAHALRAPGVRAVIAARGGYGATRILERLPWADFERDPRWIVGFSDVTALHVEALSRGIATVHASNVTGLSRATPLTRYRFMRALEGAPILRWRGLRVVHHGSNGEARGPIFGGNLALVEAMAAAGKLVVPSGSVLVLEDVTERPYRIDRMLTSLLLGGHLARAAALVFGEFHQCEPGPDRVTVDDVVRERTRRLGVPVLAGAPFGHGEANDAFVLGAEAAVRIDAQVGEVANV